MFLSNFVPFILSANIRGWIDENAYYISEGIGQEGDLILVETIENSPVFQIMNNKEETLYSNECRYILSVLGNRESSTHVCGGIPPEGLTIFKGMEIDWIGGELKFQ